MWPIYVYIWEWRRFWRDQLKSHSHHIYICKLKSDQQSLWGSEKCLGLRGDTAVWLYDWLSPLEVRNYWQTDTATERLSLCWPTAVARQDSSEDTHTTPQPRSALSGCCTDCSSVVLQLADNKNDSTLEKVFNTTKMFRIFRNVRTEAEVKNCNFPDLK